MDSFDLRGEVSRALQADGRKLIMGSGGAVKFRCVRHDDNIPSAWLGDHAWGCYACGFEEHLSTLAKHYGIDTPKKGFTVADYADRKGFNVPNLEKWGVRDETGKYGDQLVAIPYRDSQGKELRVKYRTSTKTFWGQGDSLPIYGLDVLVRADLHSPVILVEGESDCHAAWHHGVLAMGIPGSSAWKSEWAQLFNGRVVYVWQEHDEAGAKFVKRVTQDLPSAKVIVATTAKDLCDLRLQVGAKNFKMAVERLMESALPVGVNPPPVIFDAILGPTLDRLFVEKMRAVEAVPTPIPSWNQCCRDAGGGEGLARGWHVIAGAKTGTGKSLLALNLGASAIRHGERVGFCSLEMSEMQLATRLLSIVSGESVRKLEQGRDFEVEAWRRAGQSITEIHERSGGVFYVNRTPLYALGDVLDSIKFMTEVNGCRYIVVDYLQLAWSGSAKSILETVQEVSHEVRKLARDLNVVSIGLSQFNRETSKPNAPPPTPQGLMGGSPLENDADQVVLLDHTVYEKDELNNCAKTKLLLAKNRHGPAKAIPITWNWRDLSVSEDAGFGRPAHYTPPVNAGDAWEPSSVSPEDREFAI